MSALWDPSREGERTSLNGPAARDRTPERSRALALGPTHLLVSRRFLGLLISAVLLAALWLCLRVVYFNGFYLEDSPGYVTDAAYVALGEFRVRYYITGLNVGIFAPVGLALAFFGKTEAAISLWPLACSLLGMASMAAAVGVLCGRRWGMLAGVLYATYPGDIFFSTVVMPDAIQAGWLTFSVLLVILAFAAAKPDARLLVAGGAAMAVCQLIRGNGPMLLPIGVVAVAILARRLDDQPARRAFRYVLLYLAGWLFVFALESAAYLASTGDFFHRAHVVSRHYGSLQSIAKWGLNTDAGTIPYSVFAPLLWARLGEWGMLNSEQSYHALLFVVAVAAAALASVALMRAPAAGDARARAGLMLGAFWLAWPLLYHEFGSQSLTEFVPMHRLSRHLVVYAPGAMFLAAVSGALVARWVQSWQSTTWRRAAAAGAVAVLAVHLGFSWQGISRASGEYHQIKRTYIRIRENLPAATKTLIGDPGDLCFFDFWLNPLGVERVRLSPFVSHSRCDELAGAVVITRASPGWYGEQAPVIRETVDRLPCLVAPPPSWRLLYDGYPEQVFAIETESRPAADRRPDP